MGSEHNLEWMMETLDGAPDPADRSAGEEHLAHCADCRAEWDRLQALDHLLREAPLVRAPAGFAGRTLARMDRRRRVRRGALGGLALIAGGLLAAILLLSSALWTLPGLAGSLLALYRTGEMVLARLADAAVTLLNSFLLTASILALPTVFLSLCGLTLSVLAALLWVRLVRGVQPVKIWTRR